MSRQSESHIMCSGRSFPERDERIIVTNGGTMVFKPTYQQKQRLGAHEVEATDWWFLPYEARA